MKRGKIFLISMILMFSFCGMAAADYLSQKFEDMDINNDVGVSWLEYKDYIPFPQKDDFIEADLNKDGTVELFEWITFQDKDDPDMAKNSYRYKNKSGHLYKYKDGYWHKRQNEFWYRFRKGQWLPYGQASCRHFDWHYDCRWGSIPYYGYGHSHYKYLIGFSYRFGHMN
jgi:hypothetical protein